MILIKFNPTIPIKAINSINWRSISGTIWPFFKLIYFLPIPSIHFINWAFVSSNMHLKLYKHFMKKFDNKPEPIQRKFNERREITQIFTSWLKNKIFFKIRIFYKGFILPYFCSNFKHISESFIWWNKIAQLKETREFFFSLDLHLMRHASLSAIFGSFAKYFERIKIKTWKNKLYETDLLWKISTVLSRVTRISIILL